MSKDASIGWMYEGAKGNVHREDYLLGKKVDKNFEKYSDVVNAQKAEAIDSIVSTRTVFAPTEGSTGLKTSSLQKDIIKSEDPFVAVKVREETKRREIMDNPLMKMRLQNMLKTMMTSKGDKKKDKKSKKDKKKKKKRSRSSSDSSRESSPERSNKTSKKRSPSPKRRRRTSEKDEDTRSRRKDSRDDYKKEVVSRRRSRSESVERRQKLRSPKRDRSRSVERRRKSRSPRRSTESGRRSPKHQRSRSRSAERYRRKSRSPRRQRSRSDERRRQSPERSKKEERQKQRSRSRSAENHKSSKSKSSRQFDSHIPAHLQIQKRSSGSGSESESDHGRNSDDDRKEKKSYGLVEMRKRTAEEREETARAPSKEFKLIKLPDGRGGAKKAREPRRVLTEEEKAARLAEMQQDNVKWRDDVRASNVEQNRVEDEEEKKEADKNGYAPSFIRNQMKNACDDMTVEKRLQSRKGGVQRTHGYMDRSFARK